ncbi:MAG: PadR family transcriptional regulator, partial [Candidatus Nezhaarchaeales archaeon]
MIHDRAVEKDATKTLKTLGKGLLKIIILFMLMEGPKHGYEIIQEVTKRSMGLWRPSPGSLYPVLKSLEADGYVTAEETRYGAKVRKTYAITDKG